MADPALLQLEGAPAQRPFHKVPLTTQNFFSGIVSQRSPFSSLDNRYARKYLGGRPDQLADGSNVELTNYNTIIRRPGTSNFSGPFGDPHVNGFYSFHQSSGNIRVMMDGDTYVWQIAPNRSPSNIFTKTTTAQSFFQGVGDTLYFGDGVDLRAWNPGVASATRNWGIVAPSPGGSDAEYAGTGASVTFGGTAWANPTRVQGAPDSSYATSAVTSPAAPPHTFSNRNSDYLSATNYGYAFGITDSIIGIKAVITAFVTANTPGIGSAVLSAVLTVNGSPVGTAKPVISTSTTTVSTAITLGGSSDTWGANLNATQVNSATFGVFLYLTVRNNDNVNVSTFTGSVDAAQITVYESGSPTATPTGSGSFDAINGGYQYVYAYGNSSSAHVSNPTLPSPSTGNFGGAISTSTLLASGTGYAVNDTGIIIQGNDYTGTYKITGVSGSAVTTYTVTGAGTGYGVTFATTAPGGSQPGAGSGFSINITAVTGVSYVGLPVVASTDPQVNQIHVYRTKDDGSVYYELPTSPYPNSSTTIHDSNPDSSLITSIFWNSIPWYGNTPPPAGAVKPAYHLGRMWVVVGNYVYYSAGPDSVPGGAPGNGNEAFPPANFFLFPSQVNRLVPYSSGLLVFTTDDVWIVLGTSVATFYAMPFQQGVGLLSYNALDIQGTTIFLYTSDKQFLSLSSAGFNEIGYAIGDKLQQSYDPSLVYVASIVSGTSEKAVYISDGSQHWFRCNWNQPPEGGPAWSPQAYIAAGGCGALTSIETSPGVHQLLMAAYAGGNVYVNTRDVSVFTDIGTGTPTPYATCFFVLGSLVLALPGQLAEVESIVLELENIGTVPGLSVSIDEIDWSFESLPNYVNDPPDLLPSNSVMSNRWYLAQGANAARMRHMQIRVDYNATDAVKNELLTLSVFGGLIHQD